MTSKPRAHTRGIYSRNGTYWLAHQKKGKRIFVTLQTKELGIAIERAAEIRGNPELNEGGLLRAEIDRFLKWKQGHRFFTRQTAANSKNFLKRLVAEFGNVGPHLVTQQMAQGYYDRLQRKMSESSARTYVAHARSFFEWARKEAKTVRSNPFTDLKLSRYTPSARKEFCDPVLRDKLIGTAPRDDLRFVLYCGFHAGLRRNEIIEARPAWFDLKTRMLHIRKLSEGDAARQGLDPFELKDKEERSIPLSKEFIGFLKDYLQPEWDYCIGTGVRRGKNIYRYDFIRFFREHTVAQGCSWVTPHTMRRTFASVQVSKGTSIELVSKWLGDDITTAMKHYAHLLPSHDALERGL